ncbi:MAG TPA: hypothetical protein VIZ44_08035 [Gaiellaceae bacterium]
MGLLRFIERLDRLAARFNRWFGATAVASNAVNQGGPVPQADPTRVVAALGELEERKESDA